ncbi:E3 ubiquitin-protein ligase RNF31 isoform X3 [Cottoperca gobio]|uniref:E3 ubiquitin-protein ligase RNF31 isoform X3 n=1 Tax=Cottoperca gobio TaxID=56716 RepID=A0A6J2RFW7_COTGO|nr:E3 ubiquitin-protein ligase RNF31-like isoform X3 [Cottoperca gobio]
MMPRMCQYSYPGETLCDLQKVCSLFSDLRLYVDYYCFPHKDKKKLVFLAGTLPVHYEGSEYNIPVCIWLHETHPLSRPRCFVCPSVSMLINPACSYVEASGNISLHGLTNWIHGVSNLSLLMSEMRRAFRRDTPLYARSPLQALPPAAGSIHPTPSSPQSRHLSLASSHLSAQKASRWEQSREVRVRRSYTEELLGIDFSAPPSSLSASSCSSGETDLNLMTDSLSKRLGALRLAGASSREQQGDSPERIVQSEAASDRHKTGSVVLVPGSELAAGTDHIKIAACLPPDQAAIYLSLVTIEGRVFSPSDVMEAVQLSRDLPSALRFLTHSCPICQEQVSFNKIITMTHCSCFLCQTCFKMFFSSAIKEKSIDQLVCPQCGRPEVKGPGGMEYFNLLDTQIRHFLPPQIHELFQRKLRDQALQEMPNFCWCAHCSFGMLHEGDRLRMDCPSCKKSTCCQCRSPWSPQHQGLSCQQFRVWKQQNQPDLLTSSPLSYNSIVCPNCQCVFSLSKGGCLHFTCSQCQHQFCGGCSRTFTLGSACGFSADCGTKGLHAHHPRDCLYHLRDWNVPRLQLLLQYYRVSPTWLGPARCSSPDTHSQTGEVSLCSSGAIFSLTADSPVCSFTGVCLVLELRDDDSGRDEPCGRAALSEYRGYCQLHYKERLVQLINRRGVDPAALFSPAEMKAELQRWNVAKPTKKAEEPEHLYAQRLRMTLTNSIPLRKQL